MGYVAENKLIQGALGRRLKQRSDVVDFVSPVSLCSVVISYLVRRMAQLSNCTNSQIMPSTISIACDHTALMCLQAALHSLTLPAYAPDIQSGMARSFACLQHSMM